MIDSTYVYTSTYMCTACSAMATTDSPVMAIYVTGKISEFRCKDCLWAMLKNTPEMLNSPGLVATCSNCGESIGSDDAVSCGSCGDHSECHEPGDCDTSSCAYCGEEASYCSAACAVKNGDSRPDCIQCEGEEGGYYCSADCALADGGTLSCATCGKNRNATTECPACRGKQGYVAEHEPATLAAASNVTQATTNEDGDVEIDGLQFRFG